MPTSVWQRVYDSPWHNPALFWLAGAVSAALLGLKLGGLRGFLVVFGLEILADCTLTGGWSPVPPSSTAFTAFVVVFVLLGDLRYLWLMESLRAGGDLERSSLGRAAALSLVVPTVAFGARTLAPQLFTTRSFFLTYEVLFLGLAAAHGWRTLRAVRGPDEARWARSLLSFELAQYGLWALADVVILAGVELGHLLRVVPNAMYYALFLPFVGWRAPRRAWSS